MNEVICHGIPDDRALVDGDICNLDVTIFLDGVHGDTNATFLVGDVDDESRRLVEVRGSACGSGIAAVRPGRPVNEIGRAIEEHAEASGSAWSALHRPRHRRAVPRRPADPPLLRPAAPATIIEAGMTFTIEPMITLGHVAARLWDDGWTAVTADGSRTAQFEHTARRHRRRRRRADPVVQRGGLRPPRSRPPGWAAASAAAGIGPGTSRQVLLLGRRWSTT